MERAASLAPTNQLDEELRARGQLQLAMNQPVGFSSLDLLIAGLLVGLIVISIVGNCLVCVAIFTDRRLRKLGNAFIVSLAIADLFVSCLVMTFALCNDMMSHWIFGERFCDVWISFDIMCCTASILNLCAISLDRFVHIKDCLLYNQWMTRKVAISAVIIIWFISALVSFVPINLGWHKPDHFGGGGPRKPLNASPESMDLLATSGSAEAALPIRALAGHQEAAYGSPLWSANSAQKSKGGLLLQASRQSEAKAAKLNYNSEAAASPSSEPSWAAPGKLAENQSAALAADREPSANRPTSRNDYATGEHHHRKQAANGSSGFGIELNKLASNPLDGSNWPIGGRPISGRRRQHEPSSPGQRVAGRPDAAKSRQQQQQQHFKPASELPQCMLSLTPTYAIISSTISFYIPCIIMLGLYTKLFACARRHVRNIQAISKAPAPIALTGRGASQESSASSGARKPPAESPSGARIRKPTSLAALPFGRPPPIKTWLKFRRTPRAGRDAQLNDDNQDDDCAQPAANQAGRNGTGGQPALRDSTHCTSCCSRASEQSDATDDAAGRQSNSCKRCQSSLSSRALLTNVSSLEAEDAMTTGELAGALPSEKFRIQNESVVAIEKSAAQAAICRSADPKLLQNAADNQTEPAGALNAPSDEHHPFLAESSDNFSGADPAAGQQAAGASSAPTSGQPANTARTVKINLAPSQQVAQCQQQQQQQQQQSGQLATHKAAITLGIIMGTFLFCWVPFFCLNIIKAFCVDCIPGSVFRAFTWLGYANSALNPIIYGIHNSEFRNAFNRIFFKHLNIKNSRYYLNRRSSYDLRHANHRLSHQRGRFRKSFSQEGSK